MNLEERRYFNQYPLSIYTKVDIDFISN